MVVREINDKNLWENFYQTVKEKSFLNSWNWGEFQEKMGNKVWRVGVFEGSEILSQALILKIEAKRGHFLFLPHCPNETEKLTLNLKKEVLKTLLAYILDLAKKEGVSFLRIAPLFLNSPENQEIFKNFKFCEAPIHIHPEVTWILNILSSEDDLLKNMRKTTRYLIKQGEKNPAIEIEEKNDLSGLKTFNEIYQETSKRHQFVPFSFDYLEKEFFTFLKDQQSFLLLGKYKGEPVAGGIFFVWQNICFYHHGASNQKYPKIPVSYLLIWRAIKKAKDLGCSIFNFWGIAPSSNPKHPWTGLSFFKMGFGGEKKEYLKTQDLPLSLKYWLNFFVEKIRKIKRRL